MRVVQFFGIFWNRWSHQIFWNSHSDKFVGPVVPRRFLKTEKFEETIVFINIMGTVVPTNAAEISIHKICGEPSVPAKFVRAGVLI